MLKKINIILIVLLLVTGCSAQTNDTPQEEVNQVDIEQEEFDYVKSIYITGLTINLSSLETLQMCAKVSEVWSASINLGRDFSEEIDKFYQDTKDKGVIQEFVDDKKSIDSQMSDLNNPPEKYQKLYDKLLELYGEYTLVYEMAINPSGSLKMYSEVINESYSEITRLNNEFQVLIPQNIKTE